MPAFKLVEWLSPCRNYTLCRSGFSIVCWIFAGTQTISFKWMLSFSHKEPADTDVQVCASCDSKRSFTTDLSTCAKNACLLHNVYRGLQIGHSRPHQSKTKRFASAVSLKINEQWLQLRPQTVISGHQPYCHARSKLRPVDTGKRELRASQDCKLPSGLMNFHASKSPP